MKPGTLFVCVTHEKRIVIDLDKVSEILSSGNVRAYDKDTNGLGLFLITPFIVADWNTFHQHQFNHSEMYDFHKSLQVIRWYLGSRVPQMLRYYHRPITVKTILTCWGMGIKHALGNRTFKETKEFLEKYEK